MQTAILPADYQPWYKNGIFAERHGGRHPTSVGRRGSDADAKDVRRIVRERSRLDEAAPRLRRVRRPGVTVAPRLRLAAPRRPGVAAPDDPELPPPDDPELPPSSPPPSPTDWTPQHVWHGRKHPIANQDSFDTPSRYSGLPNRTCQEACFNAIYDSQGVDYYNLPPGLRRAYDDHVENKGAGSGYNELRNVVERTQMLGILRDIEDYTISSDILMEPAPVGYIY